DRSPPSDHLGDQQGVAERLAHLLAGQRHPRVVHPISGEVVAGGLRLGDLVLVVRKDQIYASAVDVEDWSEVFGGHRGALDMPTRPSRSPRRVPRRLTWAGALPQREVAWIAFVRLDHRVGGWLQSIEPL